jgi:hypothetical protein
MCCSFFLSEYLNQTFAIDVLLMTKIYREKLLTAKEIAYGNHKVSRNVNQNGHLWIFEISVEELMRQTLRFHRRRLT